MNRLSLAQRLRQEGAISGTGPTTTLGQVGENAKIVDWIDSAYQDVQNLHPDWDFLRTDLAFPTIAGTNNYTKTSIGLVEYGEWERASFRSYPASGVADEQFMTWLPWAQFRDAYVFGSMRSTVGRPLFFSQKPDTSLIVWPTPDAVYTINGEYFKRAQAMVANLDVPLIPAKYHMIIVWRALMFYAGSVGAPELYQVGEREYRRLLNELEASQLPDLLLGEALV